MGRRQIHIDDLRNTDPKTLEVVIQEAIRKPIGQLSLQTLVDLVALAEVEDLPRGVARDLAAFAGRVAQEIADLPDGSVLADFIDGLDKIDATQVPAALRDYVGREADREGREELGRKKAQALVATWGEVEPTPVTLSEDEAKIQRAEAVEPSDDGDKKSSRRKTAKKRRPRPQAAVDPDRERWLSERIMTKLALYREAGLAENVLVAGLRHEGKEQYPDLMAWEITRALKTLAEAGQVRHSAGRWSTTLRNLY